MFAVFRAITFAVENQCKMPVCWAAGWEGVVQVPVYLGERGEEVKEEIACRARAVKGTKRGLKRLVKGCFVL